MTNPVAIQRIDQFVGRTTNWLYDHLRYLSRHTPVVLCDRLVNRDEFPLMEARRRDRGSLARRVWHRVAGARAYPGDVRLGRTLAPAVLHSHFGYVGVDDLPLHQALDVPWIVSFYGADAYQRVDWQASYSQLFDRTTAVLALGPTMAARLVSLGCPPEKIVVHPLGVDAETIPTRPRVLGPGEPLRILFAGTFREKKGIQYVVEAAGLARRAGVRLELDLVGDTLGKPGDQETKDEVFRDVRSRGLEDVTRHQSFLSFQALVELALRSHVFVAPSVTASDGDAEGTPFVLQQMMATGMPAIATLHSDIPYLFGEHAHLLVPERDAGAIAARLERYAADPRLLLSDGALLRDRMRQTLDVRVCAAHLSDVYDAACGAARARRPIGTGPNFELVIGGDANMIQGNADRSAISHRLPGADARVVR
jgi:colanic acid/amylovoran/stewartan biosynthesis glycosyltransferase WcaL/AmsK/CpsK